MAFTKKRAGLPRLAPRPSGWGTERMGFLSNTSPDSPRHPEVPSRSGGLEGRRVEIGAQRYQLAGISTVSTTWITPLDWLTLEIVTIEVPPLASTIQILPPSCLTVRVSPSTVLSVLPSVRSEASSRPGTT